MTCGQIEFVRCNQWMTYTWHKGCVFNLILTWDNYGLIWWHVVIYCIFKQHINKYNCKLDMDMWWFISLVAKMNDSQMGSMLLLTCATCDLQRLKWWQIG
jgi:hypothetical protein